MQADGLRWNRVARIAGSEANVWFGSQARTERNRGSMAK
jgi:hypothetical protein